MDYIIYPMAALMLDSAHVLKFMLVLVLFILAAAEFCLFIGNVCKNSDVADLNCGLVARAV